MFALVPFYVQFYSVVSPTPRSNPDAPASGFSRAVHDSARRSAEARAPFEQRISVGDSPEVAGELLPDFLRKGSDDGPDRLIGILRLQWKVKPDELLVMLDELKGLGPRADLLGDTVQLIVKNIAEAFGKDEREDELLIFRRILSPADGTGSVPDPAFQGFTIFLISHNQIFTFSP